MKTAILAGASGLIGSQLLDLLLHDPHYDRVITVSRKELKVNHPKLNQVVFDLDKLNEVASSLIGNDVFCCLGTTMKQAGSKEAFRKVDFEYPLALATVTHSMGARRFFLVTALGSDKASSIFYNKVKGEVEEAIESVGFEALHIFQPSLLLGPRQESRAGEHAGKVVMQTLGFLIPAKYRAIESVKVARAMVASAKDNVKGVVRHFSKDMQKY